MAPLSIEIFSPVDKKWTETSVELKPGDRPSSLSNNKPDGSRELIFFECEPDDSKSTIYRSKSGYDLEIDKGMRVGMATGLDVIKEIKKGETHEMKIKTDRGLEPYLIRFVHK